MPRRGSVTNNELGGTRPREPEIRDTQMLYLIGGVARAGKSTAAESFMRTAGVSCLGVDYIKIIASLVQISCQQTKVYQFFRVFKT